MAEKITDKMEKQIEKMLLAGVPNTEIEVQLHVSEAPIRRIRRRMKDQFPTKEDKIPRIREMLAAGEPSSVIEAAICVSSHRVTRVRREMGDALPVQSQPAIISETERLRMHAERKEISRVFGKKTFFEVVGEDIINAITALPAHKPPKVKALKLNQKQEPEEMILKISDCQIGSVVNMDETGGLGAYNSEIFVERLDYLKKSLEKIFEIHLTSTPCPTIHLFFLGDIVDGRTIFGGQQLQTDKGVINQCIFAEEKIAEFVAWIAAVYPWRVVCSCVIGNHGRIGGIKDGQAVMDNFDYSVYRHLGKYLSNYPNVQFNIPNAPRMLIEIMGRRHLLTHGNNMRSWIGIPFYGLERAKSRYTEMFQDAGESYDYLHIGHFHQTAAIKGRQFMNGCWPGGSQFSIDVMQASSIPSQQFHTVHPVHGIVVTREIQLCDPRSLKGKVKIW